MKQLRPLNPKVIPKIMANFKSPSPRDSLLKALLPKNLIIAITKNNNAPEIIQIINFSQPTLKYWMIKIKIPKIINGPSKII